MIKSITKTVKSLVGQHAPYVAIGSVILLTLVSGLVQGRLSNRWGVSEDVLKIAERFKRLPKEFGDWQMTESVPLTPKVMEMLECVGYMNGSFLNKKTGETVDAFIILGPPGPVSVHTPEICYSSKDYNVTNDRSRVIVEGPKGVSNELWALTLRAKSVSAEVIRVYYAWAVNDQWSAPESPRVSFGVSKMLFKIQLASYVSPDTDFEEHDVCKDFLEAYLPVVQPVLLDRQD